MAATLRLRRSLALSSTILNHSKHFSSAVQSVAPPPSSPSTVLQNPSLFDITRSKHNGVSYQFASSRTISSRSRFNDDMNEDQISPDAILFEGCDYNHWLITMDFPKDPKPSPEEMVETYVQTAAKVLGSVEEAKKKIYACSTTTYNGFQVEVSEEVSEQFKSLPGVVFVLPDSYIDPVNKEYGGDKYINGTIIPRPPPVQYGRQSGRFNDRNRDYNRPPRGQFEQNNAPRGPGNYQRGPMPSNQVNYNQGEGRTFPPRDQGNYAHSEQRDFRGQGSNFTPSPGPAGPPGGGYNQGGAGGYRQGTGGQYDQGRGGQYGGGGYGQGTGGQYGQGGGWNNGQGASGQSGQAGGRSYGQGTGGNYGQGGAGNYGQVSGGNYGQGTGGNYGQGGGGAGNYGQASGGTYGQGGGGYHGQGMGSGGNQTSSQYGENPNFSQAGQRSNIGGQQGNYEAVEEAEAFKER
ncbi:putative peptidase S8 propeptide/proteinase inhibitor I9 superfamily [Helianthus debilis subsp. tardiflorus]